MASYPSRTYHQLGNVLVRVTLEFEDTAPRVDILKLDSGTNTYKLVPYVCRPVSRPHQAIEDERESHPSLFDA